MDSFWHDDRNLSLLMDFYELTMAHGYFRTGMHDKKAVFDYFFRSVPDGGGFAIAAGLEQVLEVLQDLRFSHDDIRYLASKGIFRDDFLEWVAGTSFECDVLAVPEGTSVFPKEPLLTVRGPLAQAQMAEGIVLNFINHQSLIATKANRIVRAAQGRPVMEFGTRRAHGPDAAIYGARAAYIGGCVGTACTLADSAMGVPALGTMAHSWVQAFPDELSAFKSYAETYPDNCVLLIDTYHVLSSGLPNAIQAFREVIVPKGYRPKGVRIDSGDLAYLSKGVRAGLDEAGFPDCKIVASSSLDEDIIRDLLAQDAPIDTFGVGEKLITAKSDPVFAGVYKLAAVEDDGWFQPKMKVSDNREKVTLPGDKRVFRLHDRRSGKAIADVITTTDKDDVVAPPYELFDPDYTWKRKTVKDFTARELLRPVMVKGRVVADLPTLEETRTYCLQQVDLLWDEVKRFANPHVYWVDLSPKLWNLREALIKQHSGAPARPGLPD
jgi:nicotinate phosphoribosyltransferase